MACAGCGAKKKQNNQVTSSPQTKSSKITIPKVKPTRPAIGRLVQ